MSWFKPKQHLQLPFPADRLVILTTAVWPIAIERAVRLRQKSELNIDVVWGSQFFNAYVCSYPRHLDEVRPELGGVVRFALLKLAFEKSEVSAQNRFDAFSARLHDREDETKSAFELGAADGASYFKALLDAYDADDHAVANLILYIRATSSMTPFSALV